MKTKSLWYVGPEKLEIREVDIPAPGCGEVLVRVDACGICAWDLFIFKGGFQSHQPFPFCFGHEGVGTVVEVGEGVNRFEAGDRVALRESRTIGKSGTGHMAEFALQSEDAPIPLPADDRPPEHWMIEPAACCVNSVNLMGVRPGQKVALVGCGFMGSILLQLLSRSPAAAVTVFEVRPESLAYAASFESNTAVSVRDARELPAEDASLDGAFDIVIESAATETAFRLANRLVRVGGKLVIFSWHHEAFPIDLGEWHGKGLAVLNTSPMAEPHFTDCFLQAVPLIQEGMIDLAPLVTHVGPPEEAAELYRKGLAKEDGYIKGVIRWK